MKNWKTLINQLPQLLNKEGICLILCPNYSFPFESHFNIPIILNKEITFKIFKKKILNHEDKFNCLGLWKSLNFVKKKDLIKAIKGKINLDYSIHDEINFFLIERLKKDKEFLKRKRFFYYLTIFIENLKLLRLLKLRVFSNFMPYIKIKIFFKGF